MINKYTGFFGDENVKFNFSVVIEEFLSESIFCDIVNEVLNGKV
ncbi:hypothetical protein [Marinitoga sp. 38H-ov]|nr:hypothetical protein [Marinitoga sp. 38H-ov]